LQSKPDIKALPPGRVCQPPFADLKAEAEDRFGYAGAERIETRWRAERIETRWRAERIETRWRVQV
jgi:hypothetical protein